MIGLKMLKGRTSLRIVTMKKIWTEVKARPLPCLQRAHNHDVKAFMNIHVKTATRSTSPTSSPCSVCPTWLDQKQPIACSLLNYDIIDTFVGVQIFKERIGRLRAELLRQIQSAGLAQVCPLAAGGQGENCACPGR